MRSRGTFVVCALLAMGLAGCGTPAAPAAVLAPQTASSTLTSQSVPPQSDFTTIQCTITQMLPTDPNGFGHQRFIVQETSPDDGMTLEVDNDLTNGEEVPGLQVGENLTIRGVEYHDPGKDGIHWTHHANVPGDAGYIETPDGSIYQ